MKQIKGFSGILCFSLLILFIMPVSLFAQGLENILEVMMIFVLIGLLLIVINLVLLIFYLVKRKKRQHYALLIGGLIAILPAIFMILSGNQELVQPGIIILISGIINSAVFILIKPNKN